MSCGRKIGPFDCCSVVCGDCLELMKQIPDGAVDAVITDPPYKISQTYTANVDADNLGAVSRIWPAASELLRVVRDGAYLAMFYDTRILPLALEAMRWAEWKYLRGLTFYRRWGNANKLYGWMSTSDFILLFRKPADTPFEFYSEDWRHDVYVKASGEDEDYGHCAQKPLDAVEHLVGHLCPSDGLVLEPWCGSGTTLLAAKRLGRHFLGFEISPEYCEIARKRLAAVEAQPTLFEPKPEQMTLGS